MEFLKLFFTALLSAAALFLVTKIIGHKQAPRRVQEKPSGARPQTDMQ